MAAPTAPPVTKPATAPPVPIVAAPPAAEAAITWKVLSEMISAVLAFAAPAVVAMAAKARPQELASPSELTPPRDLRLAVVSSSDLLIALPTTLRLSVAQLLLAIISTVGPVAPRGLVANPFI